MGLGKAMLIGRYPLIGQWIGRNSLGRCTNNMELHWCMMWIISRNKMETVGITFRKPTWLMLWSGCSYALLHSHSKLNTKDFSGLKILDILILKWSYNGVGHRNLWLLQNSEWKALTMNLCSNLIVATACRAEVLMYVWRWATVDNQAISDCSHISNSCSYPFTSQNFNWASYRSVRIDLLVQWLSERFARHHPNFKLSELALIWSV